MAHPHQEHRQHKVEHRRVGRMLKGYASGGGVHSDEGEDKKLIRRAVKKSALKMDGHKPKHRADRRARGGGMTAGKHQAVSDAFSRDSSGQDDYARDGSVKRAKGGRTNKKGTNVTVVVAPQGGGAGNRPMPMPMGAPPPAAAAPSPMPLRPPMSPQGMPPGGPSGMPPPGMMPPRRAGGRAYAKGGAVKDGPAWKEGLRDGTQVQNMPGKNDTKDIGRGKPITYAKGGGVKPGARLVQFYAGGKVEAPKGVEAASKLPGGSGGGEARLEKEKRARRDYAAV